MEKIKKELNILEVLQAANSPLTAKEVWEESKHKDNIENFYSELKTIQSQIKEVKLGTESLLSLNDEN